MNVQLKYLIEILAKERKLAHLFSNLKVGIETMVHTECE